MVVDDITAATPITDPKIRENGAISTSINLGLGNIVDLYAYDAEDFPNVVGIKIQLLGNSLLTSKAGSGSFAIFGGIAFGGFNVDAEDNTTKGSANNDYSGYEAGISLGYRVRDHLLTYIAPFYTHISGESTVTRTVSGSSTVTATPKGSGDHYGVGAGLRLSKGTGAYVALEGSFAKTNWRRTNPTPFAESKQDESYMGLISGWSW